MSQERGCRCLWRGSNLYKFFVPFLSSFYFWTCAFCFEGVFEIRLQLFTLDFSHLWIFLCFEEFWDCFLNLFILKPTLWTLLIHFDMFEYFALKSFVNFVFNLVIHFFWFVLKLKQIWEFVFQLKVKLLKRFFGNLMHPFFRYFLIIIELICLTKSSRLKFLEREREKRG